MFFVLPRLLILVFFLVLACPVQGQTAEELASSELAALEKIFVETVLADCPWPKEEVQLVNFTARPQGLSLPLGAFTWRIAQKPGDCRPGRKNLSAIILKNGQEQGQVKMSGDLKLFGPVVSLKKRLNRHEIIGSDDLSLKHREVTMLDPGFIKSPEQAVGQKLRLSLPAGAVLYAQALEAPPLVHRGEKVTIVAKSSALQITTSGEAKDAGAKGEIIRVKNLASRREIQARVAGAGIVETEF